MRDEMRERVNAAQVAMDEALALQRTEAQMPTDEQVVQICAIAGDGEHKLIALTSGGRLFERVADRQAYNTGPGNKRQFAWLPMTGPLDQPTGG